MNVIYNGTKNVAAEITPVSLHHKIYVWLTTPLIMSWDPVVTWIASATQLKWPIFIFSLYILNIILFLRKNIFSPVSFPIFKGGPLILLCMICLNQRQIFLMIWSIYSQSLPFHFQIVSKDAAVIFKKALFKIQIVLHRKLWK